MTSVSHLARRFHGSLSRSQPGPADVAWVQSLLFPTEYALWSRMPVSDRRHSIEVGRRFEARAPDASPAEMAGALLHDVGKQVAALGTVGRVVATLVGRRGRRFTEYHDHEALGAEMLVAAGADPSTVDLVLGRGPRAAALREADDI